VVFHFNIGIIEEAIMISSPCADCIKKNQPKETCVKDCEILEAIQLYQVSFDKSYAVHAIDYAEEGRFFLNSRDIT
jgi:hypothetical protein